MKINDPMSRERSIESFGFEQLGKLNAVPLSVVRAPDLGATTSCACRGSWASVLDSGGGQGYTEVVRIAIVGAGRIGGNAALSWSSTGHAVVSSRPPGHGGRLDEAVAP